VPDRVGTFEDLTVYQVAREFRKAMYRLVKNLPETEKFGLISQVRRAALSLTNNIAEGHGRFHYLEQIKFMFQARGSLQELIDDLNACEDESYIQIDQIGSLRQQGWRVRQLLDGYIGYLRKQKAAGLKVQEQSPFEQQLDAPSTNYESTSYESTL
jgi:four helix bundle protein